MQSLLHGQEQAGHSRTNASRLSLTRCRFWNATVPEKLKGQLLSKLDVNRSLFLLHASTWIPQEMQSLIASRLQGSTHSIALPRELQANKFPGGRKEQPGTEPRDEAEAFRHHPDILPAIGTMNKHNQKSLPSNKEIQLAAKSSCIRASLQQGLAFCTPTNVEQCSCTSQELPKAASQWKSQPFPFLSPSS